jgi:DNA-binding protein
MNKFQLVSDRKVEEPSKDNEIRITKNGIIGKYISYAFRIIQDENKSLVIKAMGQTIHRAIIVAEILKRRIAGLHQINELGSVEVVDIYEPIEEGLDRVELKRRIPAISIILSTQPLDTRHPGYQVPLSAELFAQNNASRSRGGRRGNRRPGSFRSGNRKEEQTESKEVGNRETGRQNGPRRSGRYRNDRRRDSEREHTNSNRQGRNFTQSRNHFVVSTPK